MSVLGYIHRSIIYASSSKDMAELKVLYERNVVLLSETRTHVFVS